MSTPTWIKDVLAGGLPAVLDYGDQAPTGVNNPDPERSPPTDPAYVERANLGFAVNGDTLVKVGMLALAAVALVYVVKRV